MRFPETFYDLSRNVQKKFYEVYFHPEGIVTFKVFGVSKRNLHYHFYISFENEIKTNFDEIGQKIF